MFETQAACMDKKPLTSNSRGEWRVVFASSSASEDAFGLRMPYEQAQSFTVGESYPLRIGGNSDGTEIGAEEGKG